MSDFKYWIELNPKIDKGKKSTTEKLPFIGKLGGILEPLPFTAKRFKLFDLYFTQISNDNHSLKIIDNDQNIKIISANSKDIKTSITDHNLVLRKLFECYNSEFFEGQYLLTQELSEKYKHTKNIMNINHNQINESIKKISYNSTEYLSVFRFNKRTNQFIFSINLDGYKHEKVFNKSFDENLQVKIKKKFYYNSTIKNTIKKNSDINYYINQIKNNKFLDIKTIDMMEYICLVLEQQIIHHIMIILDLIDFTGKSEYYKPYGKLFYIIYQHYFNAPILKPLSIIDISDFDETNEEHIKTVNEKNYRETKPEINFFKIPKNIICRESHLKSLISIMAYSSNYFRDVIEKLGLFV